MAFIKTQKLVFSADGQIISGSAAIVDTFYVKDARYHAQHHVRERLGRVIFLANDKKSGIFLSPTRGLVEYNVIDDNFSEVSRSDPRVDGIDAFSEPAIHTVFGDFYLLMCYFEKLGLNRLFKDVFQTNLALERVLAHVFHGVMRNGSRITCDNFIAKSFASSVLDDISLKTLRTDTAFFRLLGEDKTKMRFFKAFIAYRRQIHPGFGRSCYVDSTPLPNDITDNPFNALCSHGIGSVGIQMRMVLVLDEYSGLPVWFDLIPGNVLDLSTILKVLDDVGSNLGITIDSLVLDAGYASEELIRAFHIGSNKSLICRMPARKGYPYRELYTQLKPMLAKGKYAFVREHHAYFGHKRKILLWGHEEYAYVYVDKNNALQRFRDYLLEHQEEYDALKDSEKDWLTVKNGYFVLLSNRDTTPAQILSDYFKRVEIESVFKSCKEYLELLPLRKWTDTTVRGKMLYDTINFIVLSAMRVSFIDTGISISELSGRIQSLMCHLSGNGLVTVETPNKKTAAYYKLMGIKVPSRVDIADFKRRLLCQN